MIRSITLSTFSLLIALLGGCAQLLGIEDTALEHGDNEIPGVDVPGWIEMKPSCPLLFAYVNEWNISRFEDGALLKGFTVVENQGDSLVLSDLRFGNIGDTDDTVEINIFVEPWVSEGDGLPLRPGEQAGFLVPSARDVLGEILSLSVDDDTRDNLLQLEILTWRMAAQALRKVSAEIVFTSNSLRIEMPMRFIPGEETRPLRGKFACAYEV